MTGSGELRTLTARWLFPADGPPLERGTITIQEDKIAAIEPSGTCTPDEDLGNVALLPGLVNAHTHLDLSDARGKIPPTPDFTAWLRGVILHRRGQPAGLLQQAIAMGIAEATNTGTTLLGDISAAGQSWATLSRNHVRATVFEEVLGLTTDRAREVWREIMATDNLPMGNKAAWSVRDNVRFGLSPHAPYSVGTFLFHRVARRARNKHFPVAIHLAESREELELLRSHKGPLLWFLCDLLAWDASRLVKSFAEILKAYFGVAHVLFVHCNYLAPTEWIPPSGTIVYCPRTHAAFGHPPHPFREFMARGVRVVLGTDSLASNPDLDILAEARFVAARHPDLPGETLLRMITLDSAIALGWGDVAGSLTPGKSADLVVLPLPDHEERDPYRLVFDSALAVRRVMFRGHWV